MFKLKIILLFTLSITISNFLYAQHCFNCGQGTFGDFHATSDTTISGGLYEFSSFTIDQNVVVKVTGDKPLLVRSTGKVVIKGIISANGENGGNGQPGNWSTLGGKGVAGGANGGNGTFNNSNICNGKNGFGEGPGGYGSNFSGGGGGGYATFGSGAHFLLGFAGNSYGDSTLKILYGGSGGGSGSGGLNRSSGAGGAGGGIIQISSCQEIVIYPNGGIFCNGGNGGSDGNSNCGAGGGGSGGTIYLSCKRITNKGKIFAQGGLGGTSLLSATPYFGNGGKGAKGRIRIDYSEIENFGNINPAIGYTEIPFIVQIFRSLDTKCYGSNDGYAKVRSGGGKSPISYYWSNGETTNEVKELRAGNYNVTVTDNTGCIQVKSVQINQPQDIIPDVSVESPTCENKNDGLILAGSKGGIPYPSSRNITTSNTFSNGISNGIMFDVTLKKEININKFSINIQNDFLNDIQIWYKIDTYRTNEKNNLAWTSLGTYTVNSQGINESTDIILSSRLELGEGTYSFYIYNKTGSLGTISTAALGSKYIFDHSITVYEGIGRSSGNSPFSAGIVSSQFFTGHINYTITNSNNEEYDYTWGNTLTSRELKNQFAGNYNLVITDAVGCRKETIINLPSPSPIQLNTLLNKSPNCYNEENGEIKVIANDGNLNKTIIGTYLGDRKVDGIMFSIDALKNIKLNKLKLNIKDSVALTIWIKQGNYVGSENNQSLWTNLGSYTFQKNGAKKPIEIYLNNINLTAGKWSFYIHEANGKLLSLSNNSTGNIVTSNNDLILNKGIKRNGNPFSTTTGSILQFCGSLEYTLPPTNNFVYQWNDGSQNTTLSNLNAGNYTITVSDIGGCSIEKQFAIKNPTPINQISSVLNETDFTSNAIASVQPNGGTAPYYMYWSSLNKSGTYQINLTAGNYPILIVDAKGCLKYDTIFVARTLSPLPETGVLVIVPNPTKNHIKIGKEVEGMDQCELKMYDITGRLINKTNTTILTLMNEGLDLQNLSDGVYTFSLEDSDQLFTTKLMVIR